LILLLERGDLFFTKYLKSICKMNSNDLQNLSEAYNQVHQLDELSLTGGRVGFELGRGKKGLTFGVDTDKGSLDASVGKQQVGGQTDPKASIDSALERLGDAHVGGKPGNPTAAAKPSPERSVPYGSVRANFTGSVGSSPKPAAPKPAPAAKPTTPAAKPTTPANQANSAPPGVRTANNPSTPPSQNQTQQNVDPRREPANAADKGPSPERLRALAAMQNGGRDFQRNSYEPEGEFIEQFAYYQVLSYLIDEGYASSEQAADKIILNMSEAWFENIMERRREDKGTPRGPEPSAAFKAVSKMMGSGRMGVEPRGKKKDRGGPTPGPTRTPAEKVAKRRADAERAQDMMHSARD